MQEFGISSKRKKRKQNYNEGTLEIKEEIQCLLEGMLIVLLFAYFFYRSYLAFFLLSPLILFYRKHKKKQLAGKKKGCLEQQFKETILAVLSNLQAGYSMENAFVESYQDVVRIYGESSDMAKELLMIQKGMKNGTIHIIRLSIFFP